MRAITLFSGVGGAELALEAEGFTTVAQVEWDRECQAVLARHWPNVPRWGDVAEVSGADLPEAEVVVFGSPCQDLSAAGRRAGFGGDRSVLFFQAIRIIKEMRDASGGRFPRFVVWENVVGALSSSEGDDFGAVLDSLADAGALDIAWRVSDLRFYGAPQRRRRVFVVADFGGFCAGEVFAEPEGVRGDSGASHEAGPSAPGRSRSGAPLGGGTFDLSIRGREGGADIEVTHELAAALRAGDGGSSRSRAVFVNALDTAGGGPDDNDAQAGRLIVCGDVELRGEQRRFQDGAGRASGGGGRR